MAKDNVYNHAQAVMPSDVTMVMQWVKMDVQHVVALNLVRYAYNLKI